jgi:hypothetical protein
MIQSELPFRSDGESMTVRDEIAIRMMQGMLSNSDWVEYSPGYLAKKAYRCANAITKESKNELP